MKDLQLKASCRGIGWRYKKAKLGDIMYAIDASNSRDYNFEMVVNVV